MTEPLSAAGEPDRVRILVVDDAAELRLLVALVLEDEPGWEVVGEAGDGVEAIEQAGRHEIDMVLLDAGMPVMDGLEALPVLRQQLPDALLVMLTAFPLESIMPASLEAGADACLDKVNLVEELVPSLRTLVDHHRARLSPGAGPPGSADGQPTAEHRLQLD